MKKDKKDLVLFDYPSMGIIPMRDFINTSIIIDVWDLIFQ